MKRKKRRLRRKRVLALLVVLVLCGWLGIRWLSGQRLWPWENDPEVPIEPTTTTTATTGTTAPTTAPTLAPSAFGENGNDEPLPEPPHVLPDHVERVTVLRNGGRRLEVPYLNQNPEYPTGCEVTSATMALQYAGKNISIARLIDDYLSTNSNFQEIGNELYGPDPNKVFVGNPRSTASYGCFSPVIAKAAQKALGSEGWVIDASGADLDELCETYICHGWPVVVWVSMYMMDVWPSADWIIPSGERFLWPANEHCMLLVGYTDDTYLFHDPLVDGFVAYDKDLSQLRYEELNTQALVLVKR